MCTEVETEIPQSISDAQESTADACGCRCEESSRNPNAEKVIQNILRHVRHIIRSTIIYFYVPLRSFKRFSKLLFGQQEALMPVLQLAAAFDNLSRLAQKLPAALVPSRPVDGKSIEKRLFEADCHSPQQRSVDAHRNVIYKALVGNCDVALAMIYRSNKGTRALNLGNMHGRRPLFRSLVP